MHVSLIVVNVLLCNWSVYRGVNVKLYYPFKYLCLLFSLAVRLQFC